MAEQITTAPGGNPYDPDQMRADFAELQERRAAIVATSEPLREQRDQLLADCAAQENALNAAIQQAEFDLPQIDGRMAMISRALGGRTGA